MTDAAFDLGDFEDDVKAATPAGEVVGVSAGEPEADQDDDLSDFVDGEGAAYAGDVVMDILGEITPERAAKIIADAKIAIMGKGPKPTIREMIDAALTAANDLEGAQERLLIVGARAEPYEPYMRRAHVFDALARFLELIDRNQAAVGRVLRGK